MSYGIDQGQGRESQNSKLCKYCRGLQSPEGGPVPDSSPAVGELCHPKPPIKQLLLGRHGQGGGEGPQ